MINIAIKWQKECEVIFGSFDFVTVQRCIYYLKLDSKHKVPIGDIQEYWKRFNKIIDIITSLLLFNVKNNNAFNRCFNVETITKHMFKTSKDMELITQ